ncbi:MAG: VPLPA-CTERM sorting domain-containing protein [Pseudomonadota bacterium]
MTHRLPAALAALVALTLAPPAGAAVIDLRFALTDLTPAADGIGARVRIGLDTSVPGTPEGPNGFVYEDAVTEVQIDFVDDVGTIVDTITILPTGMNDLNLLSIVNDLDGEPLGLEGQLVDGLVVSTGSLSNIISDSPFLEAPAGIDLALLSEGSAISSAALSDLDQIAFEALARGDIEDALIRNEAFIAAFGIEPFIPGVFDIEDVLSSPADNRFTANVATVVPLPAPALLLLGGLGALALAGRRRTV